MLDLVRTLKKANPPREAAFDDEEYLGRMERARAQMRARGIDTLIVRNVANISYLTGYLTQMTSWYVSLVLPLKGEPFIHVNEGETALVLIHGPIRDVVTIPWRRSGEAPEDLADALQRRGLGGGCIGREMERYPLNVDTDRRLKKALPSARFVDASDLVLELRIVKSTAEIAHIRKAAELTAVGMEAALGETRLGATENDVAAAGYSAMVRGGSEHMAQAPVVQAGHRSGWGPQVTWKRSPLPAGEPVVIGLTGVWFRYGAPQFRTAVIGRPDQDTARLAGAALDSLTALLDSARPGRTFAEVARAARKPLTSVGTETRIDGSLGESVGLGLVPSWSEGSAEIREGEERVLQPGMVFHSHLGFRSRGRKGVAVGETWMVTEAGCEVFTSGRRELALLPL
jgi:Xaa-Pro dipeptidase